MPCQPNVATCTHVRVTGVRCGSPALRGERFCYFHQRMFRGVPTPPDSRLHPVALIESDEAIQASLMEVINALARNTIDLKRAELILKALYIAVKNSHRSRFDIWASRMVQQIPDYPAPPKPPQAAPAGPAESLPDAPTEPPTSAELAAASPEAAALLHNFERVLKGEKPQRIDPASSSGDAHKIPQPRQHRAPSG